MRYSKWLATNFLQKWEFYNKQYNIKQCYHKLSLDLNRELEGFHQVFSRKTLS